MITFDHVTKRYRTNIGLDDVSVHIKKGDFVFLVGPSGAGKSTFIKLILKEINADEGTIRVGDFEVTSLSNREVPIFRRKVGTVFQDFRLLPKKTVFENVAFAMRVIGESGKTIKSRVPTILSIVGLSDKYKSFPTELSGGEQQRVSLARALANNPSIIIADEPTANIDPRMKLEIMNLLMKINRRGKTVIVVTHEKNIVDFFKQRVITLRGGRLVEDKVGGMYSEGK